jgi:hypothetical protein
VLNLSVTVTVVPLTATSIVSRYQMSSHRAAERDVFSREHAGGLIDRAQRQGVRVPAVVDHQREALLFASSLKSARRPVPLLL